VICPLSKNIQGNITVGATMLVVFFFFAPRPGDTEVFGLY